MTAPLVLPTPEGLYCPQGDFYIDPWKAVARAVITHGHADHARAGHGAVVATYETLAIMRVRYGAGFAQHTQSLTYGEELSLNGVTLSLHPAGHILGSAQACLATRQQRLVVSGDYKRAPDPTCAAFDPVACDVFITEATFGLPVFCLPSPTSQIAKLLASLRAQTNRPHLLGCYALGKAQRLIVLLRQAGYDAPIYLHGAHVKLCQLYEELGVPLGDVRPVTGLKAADVAGQLILCPPSALADVWSRRWGDAVVGYASGWMQVKQRAKQKGVELPLILSDHADWPALTQTLHDVGAPQVWVTHGREEALLHYAKSKGFAAQALSLVGYEEEAD
jgi:putative mRNA 3-end processing factor